MPPFPPGMPPQGGPPMPPQGGPPMPPGGAGMPPPGGGGPAGEPNPLMALLGGAAGGGGGGAIAQVLQRLMSNPAAIQGMMNFMRGQAPTAGMPAPPSQGGPVPPGMTPQTAVPVRAQGGPPMPPQGGPPPDAETQGPPPGMPPGKGDPAEAMARDQIDKAGNTWDGVDAPTKGDIKRLEADPTPAAIKSFDAQFGKGMAEKYLEQDEGDDGGGPPDDSEGDQGSASQAEYDE